MQQVTLRLQESETSCSVKGIELYKSEDEVLSADVSIPYEYDRKHGMLMISAPDYEGEKVFKTTFKKNGIQVGTEELEKQEALKQWSNVYTEALYNQIVEHARANKMTILTRNNWDKQLSENIWVHYKDGVFCGLFSKEHSEEKNVKSVPLKSIEGGKLEVGKKTIFWNMVGTTNDSSPDMPATKYQFDKPRRGLIGILDQWVYHYFQVGPQKPCLCVKPGYTGDEEDCRCKNENIVAGHITFHKEYIKPKKGEEIPLGKIGLLPICRSHNTNTHGNEIQLMAADKGYGIWLNQYSGEYYEKEKED